MIDLNEVNMLSFLINILNLNKLNKIDLVGPFPKIRKHMLWSSNPHKDKMLNTAFCLINLVHN